MYPVADAAGVRLGAALMGSAALLFPVKDALVKAAAGDVSSITAAALYFMAQTAIVFVTRTGLHLSRRIRPGPGSVVSPAATGPTAFALKPRLILRSFALVVSVVLFFTAVQRAPIALCVVLFTCNALFLVLLAPLLLQEPLTRRKSVCVLAGLVGVGLILGPDTVDVSNGPLVLALGSALAFALYLAATRRLAGDAPALDLMLTDGLVGATVTVALAIGLEGAVTSLHPTPTGLGLALSAGAIGSVSAFLVILAMRLAPASGIAPLGYLEIVSATLIGQIVFGDPVTPGTVAGAAIIVVSCWIATRPPAAVRETRQ